MGLGFSSGEVDLAVKRSKIYKILSSFYLDVPSDQFYKSLTDEKVLRGLREFFDTEGIRKLEDFAKGFDRNTDSLKAEFTSLFFPCGEDYVVPYESYYLGDGETPRLLGSPARSVLSEYAMAGAERRNRKEIPDHVGVELEFMSYLADMEAKNLAVGNKNEADRWKMAQKRFLIEHLLLWIPDLCRRIEKRSKTDFYRGAAIITRRFLNEDKRYLEETTEREA
jgi:anaerobic sulfite reductase subunit A